MRLAIQEPTISLYNDGLAEHDKLDRLQLSRDLTSLVNGIDAPLVVALDGGWGSGKSLFLKCWVGDHARSARDGSESVFTLYFDAFAEDYLDDPLSALTAAFADRYRDLYSEDDMLGEIKNAAFESLSLVARFGLAVATSGTSEVVAVAAKELGKGKMKNDSEAANQYWERENKRRRAVQKFKQALTKMTDPNEDHKPTKKLVIVIDELDRCRPDFALELLEITKHFFAVPGVHFVLGVNLEELANSVRARYGAQSNAERYLHKFIQVRVPMIPERSTRGRPGDTTRYANEIFSQIDLDSGIASGLEQYIAMINHHEKATLRDIQRIATLAAVSPKHTLKHDEDYHLFLGLVILEVLRPDLVKNAREGKLDRNEVFRFFRLAENGAAGGFNRDALVTWNIALGGHTPDDTMEGFLSSDFLAGRRETIVGDVIANTLDRFSLAK